MSKIGLRSPNIFADQLSTLWWYDNMYPPGVSSVRQFFKNCSGLEIWSSVCKKKIKRNDLGGNNFTENGFWIIFFLTLLSAASTAALLGSAPANRRKPRRCNAAKTNPDPQPTSKIRSVFFKCGKTLLIARKYVSTKFVNSCWYVNWLSL